MRILSNCLTNWDVKVQENYDSRLNRDFVGDVDRIQQVMLNLTSNARKYVPKIEGMIKIQTELINEDGGNYLQSSVINNGNGILLRDQGKLFQKFSRLESRSEMNPTG